MIKLLIKILTVVLLVASVAMIVYVVQNQKTQTDFSQEQKYIDVSLVTMSYSNNNLSLVNNLGQTINIDLSKTADTHFLDNFYNVNGSLLPKDSCKYLVLDSSATSLNITHEQNDIYRVSCRTKMYNTLNFL